MEAEQVQQHVVPRELHPGPFAEARAGRPQADDGHYGQVGGECVHSR